MSGYKPYPRQEEFHTSRAKYRLFGGAAGPGKTKALLMEAIQHAQDVARSDSLLLRRTFPELEASLLAQFRRDVPRDWYRDYNEAKHVVTFRNGSTLRFGYCRNENEVYQYQGAEFVFIGVDELTHFTLKQWQFLTSRNRCAVPRYTAGKRRGRHTFPCMAGATNPGNIGHAWVKALWIDKAPPGGFERAEFYDAADYDFIPARIEDNPIYAHDVNYRKTLEALPSRLRKAFLEGDWSTLAGQYFDLFEIGRHTARAESLRLESWWPRWISIDWGFQHPSAVYWHCAVPAGEGDNRQSAAGRQSGGVGDFRQDSRLVAGVPSLRDPTREIRAEEDSSGRSGGDDREGRGERDVSHGIRVVTYREFLQSGLSPRMLGQAIVERTGRETICDVFLSPDAFAHRTSEASIAEQLGEVLRRGGMPEPSAADDDRVGGWQLMYQMLESDSWVVTENCRALIECLPSLVRDERRVEDVQKVEGDDAADAARYGLVSGARYAGVGAHGSAPRAGKTPPFLSAAGSVKFVPGMPVDEQIARYVTAEDMTSRAIHIARLREEAKKQLGGVRRKRRN